MIYALLGSIVILIVFYIRVRVQKKQITQQRNEALSKIGFLNEDVRILKYNYSSLKKVYSTLLKKNKTLVTDYKKLHKTLGRK